MPNELHENRLQRGELLNKRIVLFTLCGIASLLAGTFCWLILRNVNIPDALDRLITFSIGNLTGILTATGLSNKTSEGRSGSPDEPLTVTADEPLPVIDETPEGEGVDVSADQDHWGGQDSTPSPLSKAVRKLP